MLNQSFPEISDYMVHFEKEKGNKSGVLTNFFSSLHNLPLKTRAWSLWKQAFMLKEMSCSKSC